MRTLCLDNSVVSDLLSGREYAVEYLDSVPPEDVVVVPSLVRYEAYVRAVRATRTDLTVPLVVYALDAFETVGFEDPQAREVAAIRGHLLDEGAPVGAPDVLIAGIARSIGAALVTLDGHYERVPGLEVEQPRDRA